MSSITVDSDDGEVEVLEFQYDFLDRLHDHLRLFTLQRLDVIEMIHGDLIVALDNLFPPLDLHVVVVLLPCRRPKAPLP